MVLQSRVSVDWSRVRERLAQQNAALEEIFAGRGPWAEALLDRRAGELAADAAQEDQQSGGPTVSLLVARGAAGLYGLELQRLAQVVPLPRVARVPGAPPAVLGVIAVGGKVMRLFDLDRLCGAVGNAEGGGQAVVLRAPGRRPAALRVSAVERVADLPRPAVGGGDGGMIVGITADRVALVGMDALFDAVMA